MRRRDGGNPSVSFVYDAYNIAYTDFASSASIRMENRRGETRRIITIIAAFVFDRTVFSRSAPLSRIGYCYIYFRENMKRKTTCVFFCCCSSSPWSFRPQPSCPPSVGYRAVFIFGFFFRVRLVITAPRRSVKLVVRRTPLVYNY